MRPVHLRTLACNSHVLQVIKSSPCWEITLKNVMRMLHIIVSVCFSINNQTYFISPYWTLCRSCSVNSGSPLHCITLLFLWEFNLMCLGFTSAVRNSAGLGGFGRALMPHNSWRQQEILLLTTNQVEMKPNVLNIRTFGSRSSSLKCASVIVRWNQLSKPERHRSEQDVKYVCLFMSI